MTRLAIFLLAALTMALRLHAAEYALAEGAIHFNVPENWSQIMQKTEGNPQFHVFQVPNPDATGTLTRVSVNARNLATDDSFEAFVEQQVAAAAAGDSFQAQPDHAPDKGKLRYSVNDAGSSQLYSVDYIHRGGLVITVRCVRPADAPASEAWLAAYRLGCAQLAAGLAH